MSDNQTGTDSLDNQLRSAIDSYTAATDRITRNRAVKLINTISIRMLQVIKDENRAIAVAQANVKSKDLVA